MNATVHPSRLALGIRRKLLERGARVHERTEVRKLDRAGGVETDAGRVKAGAAVLAVNAATGSFPGYRLALAAASSHIVLTEPVPEVLEELGWTGGERSSTAARSCTTRGRPTTVGSSSAGAAA